MTSVSGQAAEVSVMSSVHGVVVVDVHAVDEAEVDDVDAELGVDHVAHGLLDVLDVAMPGAGRVVSVAVSLMRSPRRVSRGTSSCATAWAVASFQAIQPSSAHLMRAGYFETPANATASSSTSSSGSAVALALHQGEELVVGASAASSSVLADDEVGHHRDRGLADRAAQRVVGTSLTVHAVRRP